MFGLHKRSLTYSRITSQYIQIKTQKGDKTKIRTQLHSTAPEQKKSNSQTRMGPKPDAASGPNRPFYRQGPKPEPLQSPQPYPPAYSQRGKQATNRDWVDHQAHS